MKWVALLVLGLVIGRNIPVDETFIDINHWYDKSLRMACDGHKVALPLELVEPSFTDESLFQQEEGKFVQEPLVDKVLLGGKLEEDNGRVYQRLATPDERADADLDALIGVVKEELNRFKKGSKESLE
jgi:hypothetical protein